MEGAPENRAAGAARKRGVDGPWQQYQLSSGKQHGATLLAQLAGLSDREASAKYAGGDVGVPRTELPAAPEGEFYFADLLGLAVCNRQGVVLGKVAAVQEFGAHPVLRVAGDDGVSRLIPFVAAYVDGVDIGAARIEVDWQPDY